MERSTLNLNERGINAPDLQSVTKVTSVPVQKPAATPSSSKGKMNRTGNRFSDTRTK